MVGSSNSQPARFPPAEGKLLGSGAGRWALFPIRPRNGVTATTPEFIHASFPFAAGFQFPDHPIVIIYFKLHRVSGHLHAPGRLCQIRFPIMIHHGFYLQLFFFCVWESGLGMLVIRLGIWDRAQLP